MNYNSPIKTMKTRKLGLVVALMFVCTLVFGQGKDYAFKVMANKGNNEVKSGDTWLPLKTGASLKENDEIKIAPNAYVGLIHISGKPVELRDAGSKKVADIKVPAGATALNKYTDFILSSNAEAKKNKLGATGAVDRGKVFAIKAQLPADNNSAVLNNVVIINFTTEAPGPYLVTLSNMASEQLTVLETPEKTIQIDLKDSKYKFNTPGDPFTAAMMVHIKSKTDPKLESKDYMIKALPSKDAEALKKSYESVITELSDETALNKLVLAGFFEENKLYIDAIKAYQEAIKLAPDVPSYQEAYDEFLERNAIKK